MHSLFGLVQKPIRAPFRTTSPFSQSQRRSRKAEAEIALFVFAHRMDGWFYECVTLRTIWEGCGCKADEEEASLIHGKCRRATRRESSPNLSSSQILSSAPHPLLAKNLLRAQVGARRGRRKKLLRSGAARRKWKYLCIIIITNHARIILWGTGLYRCPTRTYATHTKSSQHTSETNDVEKKPKHQNHL